MTPHPFVPSANPRSTGCVRCGRLKAHPIHALSRAEPASKDHDLARLAELHQAAVDNGRNTAEEHDERRAIWKRLYPWMEYVPSTEEMGRRFGHRSKRYDS